MAGLDDQRTAVQIKLSLASKLVTLALAFIGVQAVVVVAVLDKCEHLLTFYWTIAASTTALTLSIVFGGLGIRKSCRAGHKGDWELSDDGKFQHQALCCLLGAILVLLSAVLGTPKFEPQHSETRISEGKNRHDQIGQLNSDLGFAKKRVSGW
jgi:hypothetical protein